MAGAPVIRPTRCCSLLPAPCSLLTPGMAVPAPAPAPTHGLTRDQLLQLYWFMRLTRTLEERLVALYRHGRSLPLLQRRTVILVDDGLGNGLMQLAAVRALRCMHAARCVVATPYATPDALQRVALHFAGQHHAGGPAVAQAQ